eukprot:1160884-Pelagomonas_calceolata.AAC.23
MCAGASGTGAEGQQGEGGRGARGHVQWWVLKCCRSFGCWGMGAEARFEDQYPWYPHCWLPSCAAQRGQVLFEHNMERYDKIS